jgi:chemosensory pili system protein ChpB (putative protein-glutamate methylesterase)
VPSPRVAVLTSDLLQQHVLNDTLRRLGFQVVLNTSPQRVDNTQLTDLNTDVWLVNLNDDDDFDDELDTLLHGEIPVLIGMDEAPQKTCTTFLRWEKKLLTKLRDLTHSPAPAAPVTDAIADKVIGRDIPLPREFREYSGTEPLQIWVLGASLGGPEAVKEFLDALPEGLPVAFVYAQHIDPRFEQALCQAVGRHSAYTLKNIEHGASLNIGDVLISPVAHTFDIAGMGCLSVNTEGWEGPYGPSIDGVIDKVARYAGSRFGCILFSGMGSDGAESIISVPEGQPLWVQSPDTCGNSSMPESAIGTGRITYVGDPYQLALQLVQNVKLKWKKEHE